MRIGNVTGDENFIVKNFKRNLYLGIEPKQPAEYFTRDYLDMQAYIYIKGKDFIGKVKTAGQTEEQLEEIWKAAYENTKGDITVGELGEYIDKAFEMGMIDEDFRDYPHPCAYVVTNQEEEYGAAAILIKEAMEKLRDRIGEFYIIPSSIHEILVVPNAIAVELKKMVREINDTVVEVKEVLSYNIYKYDPRSKEVVIC